MASGTIIWVSDDEVYFVPGELSAYRVDPANPAVPALSRHDLDRAGMLSQTQMQALRDTVGPGHVIAELRPVLLDDRRSSTRK
jgi:hypothetical protein